ncbi:MAG: hypothetical protein RIB93_32860 [Coleofasciculus sp. D1-CHI-01]
MILVDSSVWIDYFNGQDTPAVERLDQLLGVQPLAIGDICNSSLKLFGI